MQSIKFQEDNVKALVDMFASNNRILLADETGLGKTLTTVLLIAGLNCLKKQEKPESKFKVLYICSNERIARKNMRELCGELSDEETIQIAAKLITPSLSLTKEEALSRAISKKEAAAMAGRRNARLSLGLEDYIESNILIYNATPETSFRVSNSVVVGGTEEEFLTLMKVKKTDTCKDFLDVNGNLEKTNPELNQYLNEHKNDKLENYLGFEKESKSTLTSLTREFAERRRKAVIENFKNFKNEGFDLIVLDEYQSYEDILPVDGTAIENNGVTGTTISDLLAEAKNAKVLMLSATPYQSKTDEPNKFKDFRGILIFLSGGNKESELVRHFDRYNNALLNKDCSFDDLVKNKEEFEKEFQKYCRRNQRSDAFGETKKKALFSEPVVKTQIEFPDALKEEMETRKEALEVRINNSNAGGTYTGEEDSSILEIQMERDTAWGYSFSKDYMYRRNEANRELYKKIAGHNNLLINTAENISEETDSKRCDQSMMEAKTEKEKQEASAASKGLDCKRLFQPGHPKELCEAKKWPNFKVQAIRDIAIEPEENDKEESLYNCIWLPPSSPEYEPDKDSPYYKFYKKNPSKTIVFSHYKMSTRSIAALLSIEAAKGGKSLNIRDEEWDYLCVKPEQTDVDMEKGHPFLCAYNALSSLKEEAVRKIYAEKIATELIGYFKRPEIRAVFARTGVEDVSGVMRYCRNGNLTAVLREYLSIKKMDYSYNEMLLYASSKYSDWEKIRPSERLKRFYCLAWEEMKADNPEAILAKILKEGFDKEAYVDRKEEPYDGLNGRKADGFERVRVAAWKTWFAYQMIYGDNKEAIREALIKVVKQAVESRKEEITQKSFRRSCYKAYEAYGIEAHTKESYIILKYDYVNPLTFEGIGKVPNRYINSWYANHAACEAADVDEFFMQGVQMRQAEKEEANKVRKSNLRNDNVTPNQITHPMKACHTDLFFGGGGITYKIWDDVDDDNQDKKILDLMPKMHVCADFKNSEGVQCGRIPLGFASRYTNEIQDSNDHNDNGAEEVMNAFNSPFYPFVLAVTDTAKEGLNFHNYCRKIVHLNIPNRSAVLIQREGRVDRYRSLVLRQRLALKKVTPIYDWKEAWRNESSAFNGMVPSWYIETEDGPKIEKYYLINNGTDDAFHMGNIERDAELFKRTLGSFLEDDLVKSLEQRYPNEDIAKLKLNLIPGGECRK